jgi:crotonobetainyl-CoA:carnitine CoA-transferase CaiB-like acyl-CoA transferase
MLQGLRVIEFAEGISGPLAGVRLGDLGASVIKIESEDGDWLRGTAPTIPDTDISASFFELNRGKRSLALGSNPAASRALVSRLLKTADVFITDRPNAELDALGLLDLLHRDHPENPGLIVADISPWGRKGPMAGDNGSELTAQAMAGYTRYLGKRDLPARRLGADVASVGTAMFATQAVLASLLWRRKTDKGQRISLSLLNSLISMKSIQVAAQSDPDQYSGPRVGGANDPPERGWKTADKPIFFSFGGSVGAVGRPGWEKFVEEMGMQRLLDDPRFLKTGKNSTGHGSDVHKLLGEYEKDFVKFPSAKLVETIHRLKANAAAYVSADETMAHPQTQALNIVRKVPLDDKRDVTVRAFPARFSLSKTDIKGNAPAFAQHNEDIALEYGFTHIQLDQLRSQGGLAGGPA